MAVQDREDPDQQQNNSSFYLAKCVRRSSVVLQAVYGHIRSPTTLDIVFGKETSLELVILSQDGTVQSICEQPVFGKIKDLKVLPWNEDYRSSQPQTHGKDLLVLTSDSGKISFLTFCVELHRFLALVHIQISQPGNARRELGQFLAVDSSGHAVAVSALEDKVAIYPVSVSAGSNIVEKRISYLLEPREKGGEHATLVGTIWSMAFVPSSRDAKSKDDGALVLVVLLHRKGATQNELFVLVCDPVERCIHLKNRYNPISSPGHLAYLVTEVPFMPGFIVLFRGCDVLVLEISCTGSLRVVSSTFLPKSLGSTHGRGDNDDDSSCGEAAHALLELVRGSGKTVCNESLETSYNVEMFPPKDGEDSDPDSMRPSLVCAWSWSMDPSLGASLMYCTDSGEFFILQVRQSCTNEVYVTFRGFSYSKCSPIKCLLWMKEGFIITMVEMGDGEVLELKDDLLHCRHRIKNIAPILDFTLTDYHDKKQNQLFACAGIRQEGSVKVIRNGIGVEKLISTPPVYKGVTGTWTMKMNRGDAFHAFLVLSFVEETRVLSVGLSFNDVTDSVGFRSSACTLACGWIEDRWVAQVCSSEVRVCAPTIAAHGDGLKRPSPLTTCWIPDKFNVSFGAVSHRRIMLAMSQPGLVVLLGLRAASTGSQELIELQRCILEAEVSCISIPQEEEPLPMPFPPALVGMVEPTSDTILPSRIEVGKICIIGTHKPSVQVLSMVPGDNFLVLAVGHISLTNTVGAALSGCVPEDVRLVLFDRAYILAGLRNGMLLRYEWPTDASTTMCTFPSAVTMKDIPDAFEIVWVSSSEDSITWRMPGSMHEMPGGKDQMTLLFPVQLHLIAVRRIGVSPVSLVPLQASLRSDVIALGDRPFLLKVAQHHQRIACMSISFQPSLFATPVRSKECVNGILFVAGSSLHLVDMEHSNQLNLQRLILGSTPRKIVYHAESKMLLVMRSEWCDLVHGYISDICCIDPLCGQLLFSYKFDYAEVPKCMQLCKVGFEHFLLVGTGLTRGKAVMPNGEPDGAKGRLLVFLLMPGCTSSLGDHGIEMCETPNFGEGEGLQLHLTGHVQLSGVVLAVSPYLDQYILAGAGNTLSCLGFAPDARHRLKRYDSIKTRFVITCISVHLDKIAVGDCRDGILIFSYKEYESKLEQLYCDPSRRLVTDCTLVAMDTVVVTDRCGNFSVLTSSDFSKDTASPERNLVTGCCYHLGEVMLRIRKGSLAYKVVMEENLKTCNKRSARELQLSESSVVATTLLGSVVIFICLTREEYELLDSVQTRLASYPLTAPVLGNNHVLFRSRGCPAGVRRVLDGDMLGQFLELTSSQQQSVLAAPLGFESSISLCSHSTQRGALPVEQVLRLLELVQSSLS